MFYHSLPFFFKNKVLLQADVELVTILMPQHLECWDSVCRPSHPACTYLVCKYFPFPSSRADLSLFLVFSFGCQAGRLSIPFQEHLLCKPPRSFYFITHPFPCVLSPTSALTKDLCKFQFPSFT